MLMLNIIAHNGGKVVAHLGAVSNSGEQFAFTSTQCNTLRYGDETYSSDEGEKIVVASANAKDYATIKTGRSGGLRYDVNASQHLERGTKLAILGFPLGLGASANGISPIYGSAVVAYRRFAKRHDCNNRDDIRAWLFRRPCVLYRHEWQYGGYWNHFCYCWSFNRLCRTHFIYKLKQKDNDNEKDITTSHIYRSICYHICTVATRVRTVQKSRQGTTK